MATTRPLQPFVEDYHSDDSDGHVLRQNFPPRANVSTKRSEELKATPDKTQKPPTDGRSDSGYSSYTAASKSSADSAPSQRSPPVAPAPVAAASNPNTNTAANVNINNNNHNNSHPNSGHSSPAPRLRRPTVGTDQRQPSNESSPRRKTVSRNPSVSSKQRPDRPSAGSRRPTVTRASRDIDQDECTDPNCDTCGPNARKSRPPPTASALEFASYNSDQASQRSDPNPPYNPPSPTYTRNHYQQGAAVMQPSQSRRRSSSTVRVRPQSFAGEPGYWPIPGYPSPPQERGPPPAMSAYSNMAYPHMNQHYMGQQAQAPQAFYPPANQTSPPYDVQRPRLSTRESNYGQQRSYPAPIITQDRGEPNKYSARYGQQQQPPTPNEYTASRRPQPRLTQEPHVDDESSSEEEDDDSYDEYEAAKARGRAERAERILAERALAERALTERALMPPPDLPAPKRSKSKRRPTLSTMNTAPVVDSREVRERRRKSIVVDDPRRPSMTLAERPKIQHAERERERDRPSRMNTAPTRRESVSRPRLERVSQSDYPMGAHRVLVNNSRRPERRDSYHGPVYETQMKNAIDEQKRQRRASRIYDERPMPGGFYDDEEEEAPQPLRARRKTDAGKGKERPVETKNRKMESAVEEYINSTRGARTPVADSVNRAARKATRTPAGHSESGSSNSNGSGKQSISQRTNATNPNNEIRLRVDASAPIALSFNGEMEGRTLQLIPAENGMTDVVIGNRETAYHSERGSVVNSHRRSLIGNARREAEDMISERSTRSMPRNRREREELDERPVLRRTRHYHS